MGCDIHLYTEFQDENGIWKTGDVWQKTNYGIKIPTRYKAYDTRNYNFFAWLAGVRNKTWGEDIPLISEPKGIPADCCEEIKKEIEDWSGDGHSHSYFTYTELIESYNKMKDSKIEFNGAVDLSNPNPKFQEWLKLPESERGCPPDGYCATGTRCTPVKWIETLEELLKWSWPKLNDFLWSLGWDKNVSKDKIRIVFFFDN